MALSAVHKVLKHGLISEHNPDAAEAMHCIADAVTLCRFEATDPDNDDVVLSKILHVLLESVRCPTGALLSDDDVCNIVQACYRIGHQSGKESALLRNLSRHTLREIVQSVFKRLPRLSDALNHAHHIDAPVPPHTPASPTSPRPQEGADSAEGAGADSKEDEPEADTNKENEVISPRADASSPDEFTPHGEPFGLACVLEIFRFACSFISLDDPADENAETMCAFGLQLVLSSLESAGDDFAKHPALLTLVQDDLSRAVLAVAPAGNPPVLAATAATVLQMYMVMHHDLKLQLEAFLRVVLLPLAEGPKPAVPGAKTNTGQDTNLAESQRIALECIVDLCRQPEFVPDLYVNYDCDLERPNLFEEVCALLSRSAFPREGSGVGQTNLLCLEGLLAIVGGIADRSADAPPVDGFLVDGEVDFTAPSGVGSGGGVGSGAAFDAKEVWSAVDGGADAASGMPGGVQRAHRLRRNRDVKRRLISCAEHFNKSPKKGLAYMQEIGLLPDPLDASTVAKFFKHAPGLEKETLGEFLGDPKEFMVDVLKAYCGTFNFTGVTLDKALRSFLDGFKLPGEAQKISRILEVFAARYHEANPGAVADADSAYVLSYSIIMLNTDQHNPQVKNKMTLEQFVRNNRGTNGGSDWPRETLEYIFEAIATDEIKLESTDASPALSQSRWNDIVRGCATGKGRMMVSLFLSSYGQF
jgi:brefeldin A-resistance guanine nucleotide exchange factor 1